MVVALKRAGGVKRQGGAHARRALEAPSWTAHNCTILAVDTAERSGWAISIGGVLFDSGEFNMLSQPAEVRRVCRRAMATVELEGLAVVLVLESPFAGLGQGQYRGAWRVAFREAGGRLTVQVQPSVWRSRVLGFTHPREIVRQAERTRSLHDVARLHSRSPGSDEAAAVCIGYWASYAGEVAKKLPCRSAP
ncbi:MAG TPA: hypothetical protein VK524_06330 [Polyangiaceae bacterium]|nr:hypothetical protein [Polyangiaceae bacterium]